MTDSKVNHLIATVYSEFNRINGRNNHRARRANNKESGLTLLHLFTSTDIVFTFLVGRNAYSLSIPTPRANENGVDIVYSSECVTRVLNKYAVRKHNTTGLNISNFNLMSYEEFIAWSLTNNVSALFPSVGNTSMLERIINSANNGSTALVVGQVQRHIDSKIVNMLPITNTPMNDWGMGQRIVIMDPLFNLLSPEQVVDYQVQKNKEMFPWTSIGMSDALLVDNFILSTDLRKFTPYGIQLHNPQRNLYQTLGMKGDNLPILETTSALKLRDSGIARKGWTLMTAFLDNPDTFEDQIILDHRLKNLEIVEHRKIVSYGVPVINVGDELVYGAMVSIEPSGEEQSFEIHCDHALVEGFEESIHSIGGKECKAITINIAITRKFKEGTKITNRHGNKGVIRFADLGHVNDPVRGKIPLDVIVSGKSVHKRRNFGQLIEALTTLIKGIDNPIRVEDTYAPTDEQIKNSLIKHGYNENGTLTVESPTYGNVKAVCGWIFWGVSKTPEDQIWTTKETSYTNLLGLRQAGNKVSHVEMRAITTALGPKSGIEDKILSYKQGDDIILEELLMLKSIRGERDETIPMVALESLDLCEDGTIFHEEGTLDKTIHDPEVLPIGGYVKLPFKYYTAMHNNSNLPGYEGAEPVYFDKNYSTEYLYIPAETIRRPWQHKSGLMGIPTIGSMLNKALMDCKKFMAEPTAEQKESAARSIRRLVKTLSETLGGKDGHIATYGMSVRYPNSVKGVAVQKSELPKDTIEIHVTMAKALGVETGDLVLCERFPCLGFASIRAQKIIITDEPEAKYVIRVSNNSLISQGLDFDGDVLYLMSFYNDKAKKDLMNMFEGTNKLVATEIAALNEAKKPFNAELTLQDYQVSKFTELTADIQKELVRQTTGVKAHTGPVIAMCYNLMRISELASTPEDKEFHVSMEKFMDKVGKSVFGQKHGNTSLQEECMRAVCTADIAGMVQLGFAPTAAVKMAKIITEYAKQLGVNNLYRHYIEAKAAGKSKIINLIVQRNNKTYFASRTKMHGLRMLEHLENKNIDIPSMLFNTIVNPKRINAVVPVLKLAQVTA